MTPPSPHTVQRCVEAYLKRLITVTKPSSRQPPSKPAAVTPSEQPSTSGAAKPEASTPKETCPPSPPTHDSEQSSLAAALKAKKGDLKPTEVSKVREKRDSEGNDVIILHHRLWNDTSLW